MNLIDRYRRWRHGHGYGVHSPFAYFMVKEVVRPGKGYDYYGYAQIEDVCNAMPCNRANRKRHRQARTLLRLVARLGIRSTYLPKADIDAPYIAALKGADSRIELHCAMADMDQCDLVLSSGDYIPLQRLCEFISRPGKALGMGHVPQGWAYTLFESLPQGLMLHDTDSLIIVNRAEMQKLSYSIKL
jgi:hypothetical protein